MTEINRNWTKGEIFEMDYAGNYWLQDEDSYSGPNILDKAFTPEDEVMANIALIKDAFNTANKTGLTPSELMEQRDELLEALKYSNLLLDEFGKLKTFKSRWPEITQQHIMNDDAISNAKNIEL